MTEFRLSTHENTETKAIDSVAITILGEVPELKNHTKNKIATSAHILLDRFNSKTHIESIDYIIQCLEGAKKVFKYVVEREKCLKSNNGRLE